MHFVRCSIFNFLSYYGENAIEFGPTTIILGQNNTGKSKLFDAINWVLFGRAYHTESETWRLTDQWKLSGLDLINRRALLETDVGGKVEAQVSLRVEGESGEEYEFRRSLSTEASDSNGWERCSESLVVYHEKITGDTEVYQGQKGLEVMIELIPPNLRPYFLFQGESVSQLLKLSDTKAYGKAIREIARIDVLERNEHSWKLVRDRMNKRLRSAKSKDQAISEEKEKVGEEIEKLESRYEQADIDLKGYKEQFLDLNQRIDEIHEELSESEEYKKKLDDVKNKESLLDEKHKRYAAHLQEASKRIPDWLSIPAENLLDEFHRIFSRLSAAQVVPQPVQHFFLKDILDQNHCKVCDRTLDAKSAKQVSAMLERIEGRQSKDNVMQLATLIDTDLKSIRKSKAELEDWRNEEAELLDELSRSKKSLEQLKMDLQEIRGGSETDDEVRMRFESRKREVKQLEKQRTDADYAMRDLSKEIEQLSLRLQHLRERMRGLTSGGDNDREVWAADVAERLYTTASTLKEEYRVTIAKGIEHKANQYFREMTSDNRAAVGDLQMDLNTGGVYMVHKDGQPMDNVNQATRVSMQLSFVAGLLYEAGDALGTAFPFIADAPVSSLGGDNKLAAIRSMSNAFEQAVVILKDDVASYDQAAISNDPIREFIVSDEVDKAFVLSMSEGDPNTQYTVISPLKE